jgi:Mg2+ and Co2+ transporter CorA
VQRPTSADMNTLGQKYPFQKLNLEDCLSKIQIPKIDKYQDHIFVILHFPTPDKEKGFLFRQLAVFMGTDYLVTIHQGNLKPLEELFNACKNDERKIAPDHNVQVTRVFAPQNNRHASRRPTSHIDEGSRKHRRHRRQRV